VKLLKLLTSGWAKRHLQRTEDEEQAAVIRWLNAKGYHFWHTPNSTYTKSWAQKNKNTRLGVQAGIPDIFVLANGKRIAIEMKRTPVYL